MSLYLIIILLSFLAVDLTAGNDDNSLRIKRSVVKKSHQGKKLVFSIFAKVVSVFDYN